MNAPPRSLLSMRVAAGAYPHSTLQVCTAKIAGMQTVNLVCAEMQLS